MQQNEGLPALCSCDAQFSQLIINKNDITIYDRGEDFWQKMGIRDLLYITCQISQKIVYMVTVQTLMCTYISINMPLYVL